MAPGGSQRPHRRRQGRSSQCDARGYLRASAAYRGRRNSHRNPADADAPGRSARRTRPAPPATRDGAAPCAPGEPPANATDERVLQYRTYHDDSAGPDSPSNAAHRPGPTDHRCTDHDATRRTIARERPASRAKTAEQGARRHASSSGRRCGRKASRASTEPQLARSSAARVQATIDPTACRSRTAGTTSCASTVRAPRSSTAPGRSRPSNALTTVPIFPVPGISTSRPGDARSSSRRPKTRCARRSPESTSRSSRPSRRPITCSARTPLGAL